MKKLDDLCKTAAAKGKVILWNSVVGFLEVIDPEPNAAKYLDLTKKGG